MILKVFTILYSKFLGGLFMQKFCDTLDSFPLWLKIIIAIPFLDIVWAVYRIFKSIMVKNWFGVVIAGICVFLGLFPVAIFDIIYLAIKKDKVWWLD